jgi:flagellin-like hook-associated protein FlgL
MTTSTYKGRDVFNTTAGSLYVSMGGRDQEMTFGIGRITYTDLYNNAAERTIQNAITNDAIHTAATVAGPNQGAKFNLAHLPSDAVTSKDYGKMVGAAVKTAGDDMLTTKTYVISKINTTTTQRQYATGGDDAGEILAKADIYRDSDTTDTKLDATSGDMEVGDVVVVGGVTVGNGEYTEIEFKEVLTGDHAFKAGDSYVITSLGAGTGVVATTGVNDASSIARAVTGITNGDTLVVGQRFTVDANASIAQLAHINSLTEGMTFTGATDTLTKDIEAMQGLVNTARVQAGSQYAAIESAVNYTTDLTAQYELGYNTVNDVNFSMETAHLAKNQILQQAATAMLAQANQGQQGLLQLIS